MKQVNGFWLPEREQHLVEFLENGPEFAGGPTYQLHKLLQALPHVTNFHHAIDVGAHCGLWSRVLARMFTYVTAFEPVPAHVECFLHNLPEATVADDTERTRYVELRQIALGERHKPAVSLHTGVSSTGDTYVVDKGGEHHAAMQTLAEQAWPPADRFGRQVNFLKLDCEGYEYFILKGGEQFIRANRPVIVVEQKPGKGNHYGLAETAACDLLRSWGAGLKAVVSGDYIFAWPS